MDFPIPEFLDPEQANVRGIFESADGTVWCVLDVENNWGYVPDRAFARSSGQKTEVKISIKRIGERPPLTQLEPDYKSRDSVYFGPKFLRSIGAPEPLCLFGEHRNLFAFLLRGNSRSVHIVQ